MNIVKIESSLIWQRWPIYWLNSLNVLGLVTLLPKNCLNSTRQPQSQTQWVRPIDCGGGSKWYDEMFASCVTILTHRRELLSLHACEWQPISQGIFLVEVAVDLCRVEGALAGVLNRIVFHHVKFRDCPYSSHCFNLRFIIYTFY